jgi:hypothetical protein
VLVEVFEVCRVSRSPQSPEKDVPAKEEEEQEAAYDDCQNNPSNPRIPGGLAIASDLTITVAITALSHYVSDLCL